MEDCALLRFGLNETCKFPLVCNGFDRINMIAILFLLIVFMFLLICVAVFYYRSVYPRCFVNWCSHEMFYVLYMIHKSALFTWNLLVPLLAVGASYFYDCSLIELQ